MASTTAAATAKQHHVEEDAEVAAITLSGGHHQQLGLPLLHHLEAILGQQQPRSSCRSTPPVLPGTSSSSNCCTPSPGRRSCSALELAAIAERYIQPALSPAAAAAVGRSSPSGNLSILAGNTASATPQQQQLSKQLEEVTTNTTNTSQQRARRQSNPQLLPPRVQISSKDLKQRLLVEPPSSPQLLPHTQGRSATLLSAVHDTSGGLDLDLQTPSMLSPAAHAAESHAAWSLTAAGSGALAAGLAAIGDADTAVRTATAIAVASDLAGVHLGSSSGAAADMHSASPCVVMLPPNGVQPSCQSTERWRAAVSDPAGASSAPAAAATVPALRQGGSASPDPVVAGSDRGRPLQDGRGRLRGVHVVEAPASPGAASVVEPEDLAASKRQQQRSRSSSVTNSRSCQGRRGACRSLSRTAGRVAAAATAAAAAGSDERAAAAGGVSSSSGRGSEAGVRRSSGGGGRAREPAGPLELDPCAPPLGSSKLSQPVLADVDYIVHRWSHRWVRCMRWAQACLSRCCWRDCYRVWGA
jgi:hypothetical protein